MTAGEINKALDRLDAADSKLTEELIRTGRGRELRQTTLKASDPLALKVRAIYEQSSALRNEISRRYGPGEPSRLPKGFGPVKNPKPRKRVKNLRDRRGAVPGATGGNWVVTATKKRTGLRYYYAGGARLASEEKFAARFASAIHASRVKDTILRDFPAKLTGAYYWQSWPLAA